MLNYILSMSAKKSRQNVINVGKTDTKMKHICRCTKSLHNKKADDYQSSADVIQIDIDKSKISVYNKITKELPIDGLPLLNGGMKQPP